MHDTATGAGYGIGASKGITGGRKGYKAALFEGGIGVPFIARWPGKIAAGKVDDTSLISAVDLLPTFCEVAGVKLPDAYKPDGVSQVATLMGKAQPTFARRPLFWKMHSAWPIQKTQPYHWVSYAVVDQHWKLLTNRDASSLGTLRHRRRSLREDRSPREKSRCCPPTNAAARSMERDATSRTKRRRILEGKNRANACHGAMTPLFGLSATE